MNNKRLFAERSVRVNKEKKKEKEERRQEGKNKSNFDASILRFFRRGIISLDLSITVMLIMLQA